MAVPAKPEQDVNLFHYERAANSASDKEMAGHPHDTAPIEGTTIGPKGRWLSLRLILAIFSLATIYSAALATFVSVAPLISIINEDIGPISGYSWMATSWTISGAVSVAVCGSVSDLVGRRWVAIGSGGVGIVGAVVGATANTVPAVIAAMTIFGVAGGGCLNSHPAICELVPTRARGKVLAIVNMVTSMWAVFGSLFAFHMADNYGWRSVFWVALAIHSTGSILCFIFYKPSEPLALDGKTRMQILRDFDWIGLAGLTAGPTLILLGISWLGGGYDSRDAHFIVPLVTGIVTCIALGFYEAYIPSSPILHPHLFKMVRSFTVVLVLIFVGGMLFYSLQSLYPAYVQAIFTGPDPTKIGLWSVCLGAGTTLGGVASGFLLTKLKNTKLMLLFGISTMAVFIALMAIPKPGDKSMALAFSFFGGIGIGWEQTLGILVVQLACPDEWIGFATGILGLFRICGGAAGTAIYSTVLSTQLRKHLPKLVSQAVMGAGIPPTSLEAFMTTFLGNNPSAAGQLPGVDGAVMKAAAEAAKLAYYKSFRLVWLVTIPFGVAGVISALVTADQSHKLVDSTAITLSAEERER